MINGRYQKARIFFAMRVLDMTECSASRAINKPLSQSFGPAFVYFVPKTVSAGAGHLISPSDPQQGPYQLGHVRVIIQSILLIKE